MKSSTKIALISAAVSAALGSSAYALVPASWSNTGTTPIASSNVYYAAGGSAEELAIFSALYNTLTPGTVDVYTDGTGSTAHPGSNSYLVVSGTTNANSSLGANVNIGFIYKFNGGSGPNGMAPQVGTGATLSYPTLASLANVTAATTVTQGQGTPFAPTYNSGTGVFVDTDPHQPDFGICDTEEALLNQPLNLPNIGGTASNKNHPIAAYNISGANSAAGWIVTFGIAVTDNVYAQKKHWSKGEVAAVLAGKINTWTQLTADNGSAMTLGGGVLLLDRGSGSGTKATENAYFLNYPATCNAQEGGYQKDASSTGGACSTITSVNQYSSLTLAAAETAGTFVDYKEASSASITEDLVAVNVANQNGAIAVLGLEFPPSFFQHGTGTNDYWFVSLNGAYPDTETGADYINNPAGGSTQYTNLVNGTYDFWAQTSINALNPPTTAGSSEDVYTILLGSNTSVPVEKVASSHTGSAFPTSAPGIMFNSSTTGATDAGNLGFTNGQITVAPKVFVQATSAAAVDPL